MTADMPGRARQLRSLVTEDGRLVLSLATVPVPVPGPDEVLVRIEAAPVNPSDLGLLLAGADLSTAVESGTADDPVLMAAIPAERMPALAARVGVSMQVGNEGAGVVVRAGSSGPARALLGETVAVHGGAMYSQFRCVEATQCLVLAEGTRPAEGASAFVNPLTALGMVATMRREGHTALVHTAAASNLGRMLHRLCLAEDVPLVSIVRRPEQEQLLRDLGAVHVCNSNSPTFSADLTGALAATSATLAFDATGGGRLPGRILAGMEAALTARSATAGYSRYGSATRKQVYIYGSLHPGPTVLDRAFGMAWGIGGWLLPLFLEQIGPEEAARLRRRVAAELKTTFASTYGAEISLAGTLRLDAISRYARQATGGKFLVNPWRDLAWLRLAGGRRARAARGFCHGSPRRRGGTGAQGDRRGPSTPPTRSTRRGTSEHDAWPGRQADGVAGLARARDGGAAGAPVRLGRQPERDLRTAPW